MHLDDVQALGKRGGGDLRREPAAGPRYLRGKRLAAVPCRPSSALKALGHAVSRGGMPCLGLMAGNRQSTCAGVALNPASTCFAQAPAFSASMLGMSERKRNVKQDCNTIQNKSFRVPTASSACC